jgi:riboflavin synthase
LPASLLRHVVEKGSITLDGVSLTVAALGDDVIDVALIPHTLDVTTLGSARVGDRLNVEVDVIAKYVARNLEYLANDGDAVVRPGKERTA